MEQGRQDPKPAELEILLPSAYSYGGFVQMRTAPATLPAIKEDESNSRTSPQPE